MSKLKPTWAILCAAVLALAGCRGATPQATETQPPQAVFTAAAQTAQARMTEMAAVTPTQATTPTFTVAPTQAVTLTVTAPMTATGTLTGTAITPGVQTGGTDKLDFVRDVTIPDGTQIKPGEAFVKTWELKNTGTSTWTPEYSLAYASGEQMGAPASIPLSGTTPPGQSAQISVNLTAPQTAGSYFSFWVLRSPSGKTFAVGPNGDQPFYVQIIVGESSAGNTTPGPSGDTVTDVTMVVDNAAVEGSCPHTFYFVGRFVLNKAATVTYQMEAETGFEITLPAPTTVPLDAGIHTVNYTLEFPDSVEEGTASFHITSPDDVQSAPVGFTLKCD